MRCIVAIILLCSVCGSRSLAQPLAVEPAFPRLAFELPVGLEHAPGADDRLFVVCQRGRIVAFPNRRDADSTTLFLDLSDRITDIGAVGALGLLGLAFDPGFETNGTFYCYYAGPGYSTVARYSVDPERRDIARESSEEIILRIPQTANVEHVAGRIAFGSDGYLYIATGDGWGEGDPVKTGEDTGSMLGKILRIDVHDTSEGRPYAIPADNPFAGSTRGEREEIYAYGFRNPWRFSFDIPTGRLWAADVGEHRWEEIDLVASGGNYGWSTMEGPECLESYGCDTAGHLPPVWSYIHNGPDSVDGNAIIGGYVYRGSALPMLRGSYIHGDGSTGNIWALDYRPEGGTTRYRIAASDLLITSFGLDRNGEIYICHLSDSARIYHLVERSAGVDRPPVPTEQVITRTAVRPQPAEHDPVIDYTLAAPTRIRLSIIDARGVEIRRIVDGMRAAGDHHELVATRGLARGSYYYLISAGDDQRTGPLLIR